MAKLPNRLVIEIANTDKVDELGNPVIGFESKDYAECVIEELENIKDKVIRDAYMMYDYSKEKSVITVDELCKIIHRRIFELKGKNK